MSFHVSWTPSAERELTELWTRGPNRAAIQVAADALDAALARDPLSEGESRSGNTRLIFRRPLAILCDVDSGRLTVRVWAVGLARRDQ